MKLKRSYFVFVLIFILGCIVAFLFEGSYHTFIRSLYPYLADGNVNLVGGKEFHFPSYLFVISFGIFCILVSRQIKNKLDLVSFAKLLISVMLFFQISFIYVIADRNLKRMQCDLCNGEITINNSDINSDATFITSLIIAYFPFAIRQRLKR